MHDSDAALIRALRRHPRASITALARATNMARGTVQSRLARLAERGVITGYGPDLDPASVGYGVTAFTTLSIAQGAHDDLVAQLAAIPEVLEVHVVTGSGDLLCRLTARSNDDLHQLLQRIVAMPEVGRTDTQLALSTPVRRTLADLIAGR